MMRSLSRVVPVAFVALLACGCGHRKMSAHGVVRAYLDALERERYEEAFAWLSRAYRDGHSAADLAQSLSRADARLAHKALARATPKHYAELELSTGDRVRLVEEDGQWRLADNPLEWFPQSTPKEALQSFSRALERQRYDIALRFVPSRYRASATEASLKARWDGEKRAPLLEQLKQIAARLHEPFDLDGDSRATLPLGGGRAARLIREDTVWKVESFE